MLLDAGENSRRDVTCKSRLERAEQVLAPHSPRDIDGPLTVAIEQRAPGAESDQPLYHVERRSAVRGLMKRCVQRAAAGARDIHELAMLGEQVQHSLPAVRLRGIGKLFAHGRRLTLERFPPRHTIPVQCLGCDGCWWSNQALDDLASIVTCRERQQHFDRSVQYLDVYARMQQSLQR